jgi:alanine racemase
MTQPELPSAALRLELDAEALTANWHALNRLSGSAAAGAAVKANAYGLGARRVVTALHGAGCRDFFVAHWSEAADLLDLVDPASLAVLHGPLNAAEAGYARATGLRPVINSISQAQRWLAAGGGPCHLMIDTGINRLGLPLGELGDPAVQALDVEVLHSHLASADEDAALNAVQQARFIAARQAVRHQRASLANSAGIALGHAYHANLTRPGLSLYGGVPRAELAREIRQVAKPMAALMQVRQLAAGDGVGYNSTFITPQAMRAGVIALGYADGYLRCWSGKGRLNWQGIELPVIGRVSMDMTIVNLTAAPALQEGDWLEVAYSLPEASAASGLSQYELLTLLDTRFAR